LAFLVRQTSPPEKRPPLAEAMAWVSRIMAVSLEMVLPGLAGLWLDDRIGTRFLMFIGFGLGFTAGMVHLLAMTKSNQNKQQTKQPPSKQGPSNKDSDR